jgi:hypothetical protein
MLLEEESLLQLFANRVCPVITSPNQQVEPDRRTYSERWNIRARNRSELKNLICKYFSFVFDRYLDFFQKELYSVNLTNKVIYYTPRSHIIETIIYKMQMKLSLKNEGKTIVSLSFVLQLPISKKKKKKKMKRNQLTKWPVICEKWNKNMENPLKCDGVCSKSHHPDCAGVSRKVWKYINDMENLK